MKVFNISGSLFLSTHTYSSEDAYFFLFAGTLTSIRTVRLFDEYHTLH